MVLLPKLGREPHKPGGLTLRNFMHLIKEILMASRAGQNVYTDHKSGMFGFIHLKACASIAIENTSMPMVLRIYFLGLNRLKGNGHACFEKGEIVKTLVKADGTSRYSTKAIRNAINDCVAWGYLAPSSNSNCLVYPTEIIEARLKNSMNIVCPEHKTSDRWSNRAGGGWADSTLYEPKRLEKFLRAGYSGVQH